MGVATGYGCKEVIDFLILLIPTPLVSVLFCSSICTFCSLKKMFFVLVPVLFCNYIMYKKVFSHNINGMSRVRWSP